MAFGAIVGGMVSAYAADQSSGEVSDAADMSAAEQQRQFDLLREDTQPYRQTGQNALYEMSSMLGLGSPEYYQTQNRLNELRDRRSETDKFTTEFDTGDYVKAAYGRGGSQWYRKEDTYTTGTGTRAARQDAQGISTDELLGGTAENQRVTEEWRDVDREIQSLEQELEGLDPQAQGAESQFDISQTPGYQFRFQEGMNALDQSLAATGNRFSGRAAKAAQRYGQGLASQEFSNRFNRLASLSGRGQAAVETSGQAGMQAAGNIGNAMMAGGQAQAAGTAGVNQAIQGGIGNYLSNQQNQNMLNQLGNTGYTGGNTTGTSYGTGTGSSPVSAYGR